MLYIWLIGFIFGDLKLSQNRQNGEHNIVSSANQICHFFFFFILFIQASRVLHVLPAIFMVMQVFLSHLKMFMYLIV